MQVKTIMRYHYIPAGMAKSKRQTIPSGSKDMEKLELSHTAVK